MYLSPGMEWIEITTPCMVKFTIQGVGGLGGEMKATVIVDSIRWALEGDYDKDAAVKRLNGYVKRYAGETLHVRVERGRYRFYRYRKRKAKYIGSETKAVYELARKRHCALLIKILKANLDKREKYLEKLLELLVKFEAGGLELERIVFSQKQYQWYRGSFIQKPPGDASHELNGIMMRSKSEKTIGRIMNELGVPFHFEERLIIDVIKMVDDLRIQLEEGTFFNWEFKGKLFFEKEGRVIWLVPSELQWMNSSGSVWKSYNPMTGKITIFPDFKIMLADGVLVHWEHEGFTDNFTYRCNANERESVMRIAGKIKSENLIITYEEDTEDDDRIREFIKSRILPRLWW